MIPNAVQLFLTQRPEPKPLVIRSSQERRKRTSFAVHAKGSAKRKVDLAGGYDFEIFERRNWAEIFGQLRLYSPPQTTLSSTSRTGLK
jgi:hypothetical protein